MRRFLGLMLAVFLNLSHATEINQLVVFGDSLSDRGNLYEYMNHQLPMSPPYFQGRFTNGQVWIEHLVARLFPSDTQAHFLDFAYGGANVASNNKINDFSLQNQVKRYFQQSPTANPKALYVFWVGSNNYLDLPDDIPGEVNQVLTGIQTSMEEVIAHGGQQFMVVNVPQLDTTPAAIEFEAEAELKSMADLHNQGLKQRMQTMRQRFPGIRIVEYDVAKIMSDIVAHPAQHDFRDATRTCCEFMQDAGVQTLKLPQTMQTSRLLQTVNRLAYAPTQDQCYDYLFFDLYHPTAHAHWLLAQEVYQLLMEQGFEFYQPLAAQMY